MLIRELFKETKCNCSCGKASNVSVGAVYRNNAKRDKNGVPKAKQALNKDGTAKNGLDMGGSGLLSGGSIAKR